jgi:hypothetical protein
LVKHTSADFTDNAQSDGDDFVFIYDDNSKLDHEIEYYDSTDGELIVWVNLPYLSSTEDTIIWIYYGNSECGNQQSPEDVWDSNFKVVYHMNYESGGLIDSTSDDNDCNTIVGSPEYEQDGKVGYAIDFERSSNDAFEDGDILDGLDEMTVEAWVNLESYHTSHCVISSHEDAWYFLVSQEYHSVRFDVHGGVSGSAAEDDSPCPLDTWYYVVGSWSDPEDRMRLFGNGELKDTYSETLSMLNSNYHFTVGYKDNQGNHFDGLIDEVRVSNIERSAEWINTTYINQNDIESFLDFGEQEKVNFAPYAPSDPNPYNGENDVNINIELSWVGGDPDGDPVTFNIYFGNLTPPPKIVDNQSEETYTPITLDFENTYYWQIIAWDNKSAFSEGEIWEFTTMMDHTPEAPEINGPLDGKIRKIYPYNFAAEDPDGDDVYYEIDWGDGIVDSWIGPFESNKIITRNHSWAEKGNFIIKARAKDIYGAIGDWGTLEVTMPKNKQINFQFNLLNWLYEQFPYAFPFLKYILGI